jgi:8-amino-3,8-dideoxy-alpha-D-manno-octulosonate transaminase
MDKKADLLPEMIKRAELLRTLVQNERKTPMITEKLAIHGGPKARPSAAFVPVVSPGALMIDEEEIQGVTEVLRRKVFNRHQGPEVSSLEKEFAQTLGVPYVVALNSGSSALNCALFALGIKPGDEVIMPSFSFIGDAAAVLNCGATPVFCEIDNTLTLSVDDAINLVNERTKAIVAVHMRGAPCDMERLEELCRTHGISLIEDVAQANGGSFKGKPLGTFGRIGCFSLQQFKVITTGEGGFLVTSEPELYKDVLFQYDAATFWSYDTDDLIPLKEVMSQRPPKRVPPWSYHTDAPNYLMPQTGLNLRMGEMEGAFGRVQLRKLNSIVERLRERKEKLLQLLGNLPGCEQRAFHDADGEVGIALLLQIHPELPAGEIQKALFAEGIEASLLLPPGMNAMNIPERHFCDGWGKILGSERLIGEHRCQSSKSLLNRMLQIQINPTHADRDLEEIAEGVRKVFYYFADEKRQGSPSSSMQWSQA